jgi:uroporphyrinogen-III synthase
MRVLVTRPEDEARRWVDELRQHGIDAVSIPLIAIVPAIQLEPLHAAWCSLEGYRAVMFVSGNAVRHFFGQRPARAVWPPSTRAWATGAGTRAALLGRASRLPRSMRRRPIRRSSTRRRYGGRWPRRSGLVTQY